MARTSPSARSDLLRRYTQTIVLALDADARGQGRPCAGWRWPARRSAPAAGPSLEGHRHRLPAALRGQIKIAVLTGGSDLDEIVRDDPQAWQRLIDSAVPMMDHKLELELGRVDPADAQAKRGAVQELARFLVQVPDPIAWGHYIDLIAQRLRLDLREVRDEVQRARARGGGGARQAQRERGPPAGAGWRRPGGGAGHRPLRRGSAGGARKRARRRPSARPLPERRRDPGASAGAGDVSEEHLVAILVLAPHLLRRMPVRLTPEDFRSTECREVFRALLSYVEGGPGAGPRGAGEASTNGSGGGREAPAAEERTTTRSGRDWTPA